MMSQWFFGDDLWCHSMYSKRERDTSLHLFTFATKRDSEKYYWLQNEMSYVISKWSFLHGINSLLLTVKHDSLFVKYVCTCQWILVYSYQSTKPLTHSIVRVLLIVITYRVVLLCIFLVFYVHVLLTFYTHILLVFFISYSIVCVQRDVFQSGG